jgi:hypothetical protein
VIKYLINKSIEGFSKGQFKKTLKKIILTLIKKNKISLDDLKVKKLSLDELFKKFGSDKGTYDTKKTFEQLKKNNEFHGNYYDWINRDENDKYDYQLGNGYSIIYDKYFKDLREKKNNLLEIGVANGHSSASFYNYFCNSIIHCLDLKPKSKFFYSGSRLNYYQTSIFDNDKINKFLKKKIKFDIIIDDSQHDQYAALVNLKNFLPSLNNGGYYIIEDFVSDDIIFKKILDFHKKKNKKLNFYTQFTIQEIFEKLSNRETIEHQILNLSFQEYIIKNTKKIDIHFFENPISGLIIIQKI